MCRPTYILAYDMSKHNSNSCLLFLLTGKIRRSFVVNTPKVSNLFHIHNRRFVIKTFIVNRF